MPQPPDQPHAMTKAEARDLLRRAGYDGMDAWIAAQPWQVMPGGWQVPGMHGWRFRIEVAGAGRLRVMANTPGGDPAAWPVPVPAEVR